MNNKYIFGGIIIAVFLGIMIYLFTQTSIKYEDNFSNISTQKIIKAAGTWVKEKGYDINTAEGTFSFFLKDNYGKEMKVVLRGNIPNNFEISESIVVTGKYNGHFFEAKSVLTKCPSKYQEQMKERQNS